MVRDGVVPPPELQQDPRYSAYNHDGGSPYVHPHYWLWAGAKQWKMHALWGDVHIWIPLDTFPGWGFQIARLVLSNGIDIWVDSKTLFYNKIVVNVSVKMCYVPANILLWIINQYANDREWDFLHSILFLNQCLSS